jgi:hypothetical protein
LNTLHDFNPATILPSLRSGNPLVFINPSTPTKPDQTYDLQPGGSGNTPIVLGPPWAPTILDIDLFDHVGVLIPVSEKGDLHVCVVAYCVGRLPRSDNPSDYNQPNDGEPVN